MMKAIGVTAVLLMAALFGGAACSYAQVTAQAQLNGFVRDQSGHVVVKGSVTLRNVDTNQTYSSLSNDTGYYVLTNLPPGNYRLEAESAGFRKYEQTGVVL